jgi:hypothetical protein
MAYPGACDQKTIDDNQKIAAARVGDTRYAAVDVLVTDRTWDGKTGSITFAASTKDGSIQKYLVPWGDEQFMWAPCPSSLPSKATTADVGEPPAVNASGRLYLSDTFLSSTSIVAATLPKWPKSLPGEPKYKETQVWPIQLLLVGTAPSTEGAIVATINLLDPAFARPGEHITTDHTTMSLCLSQPAWSALGLTFEDAFKSLSNACELIKSQPSDAEALVHAWAVVAAAVRKARDPAAQGQVDGRIRNLLTSVLQGLQI